MFAFFQLWVQVIMLSGNRPSFNKRRHTSRSSNTWLPNCFVCMFVILLFLVNRQQQTKDIPFNSDFSNIIGSAIFYTLSKLAECKEVVRQVVLWCPCHVIPKQQQGQARTKRHQPLYNGKYRIWRNLGQFGWSIMDIFKWNKPGCHQVVSDQISFFLLQKSITVEVKHYSS